MTQQTTIPVVMTISGNDPTGGAGIQADIEALASMGCHTAPVITALTVQDTQDVVSYIPVDPSTLIQQARAVLEDVNVSVFKIGMLGSVEVVEAIHTIITDYPEIPVVLDPVLVTGGGTDLVDEEMQDAIKNLLFPLTNILTPNSVETRLLAPEADTLDACAHELLDMGCEFVLVTGTHEGTDEVINRLYGNHRMIESFHWERFQGSYHGSGCTLASAIAGLLAQGLEPLTAVHEAQEYTWETLKQGYRIGMGQFIPNRLFWAREPDDEHDA
ncbi:MAG: bifunctional hydroxymethylpyrimidine kinase/phosphomethylpyrimidine kinase [Gammaproteobacteria bacterium]